MPRSAYTPRYRVFIAELVKARKSAGLTQQELADLLDRPQSFVAKYEKAERRLDVVEFLDIAEQLDADPHRIIRHLSE